MTERESQAARILEGLRAQFASNRFVWWEAPEGGLAEVLDELDLEGVAVLRRDVVPALVVETRAQLARAGLSEVSASAALASATGRTRRRRGKKTEGVMNSVC